MITVVGEALVDLVVAGDGAITATPGGAPFNVARACARLGAPVSLIAAVSTDKFGARLRTELAADGVRTDWLQVSERPTTLALAELDSAGGATYRFYLDGTSAPALTAQSLPAGTRALVAGGLGLAVESMATAVERIVVDAAGDVLVLVDVNCRPDAIADRDRYLGRLDRVLARANVVKASVEDLETVDVGRLRSHAHAVLLTAGAAATTVLTAAGEREIPVGNAPVVDTIGAGDTFTAGFLTWWLATGRSAGDLTDTEAVVAAVRAAHQVAALVVGRRGADPPRREELSPDWDSFSGG